MLPLNNAPYMTTLLTAAQALPASQAWALVALLLDWTGTADAGGFYDDLGRQGYQPHLVSGVAWEQDPDYYVSPLSACDIAKDERWSVPHPTTQPRFGSLPVPWQTFAATYYNAPLILQYNLSAAATRVSIVRNTSTSTAAAVVASATLPTSWSVSVVYPTPIVYGGRSNTLSVHSTPAGLVRLTANGHQVHDFLPPPAVTARQQFAIPAAATAGGQTSLELVWTMPPDAGGNGIGCKVAEVLLLPVRG